MANEEATVKKSEGKSVIASVVGTVVLAAACGTAGWVARGMVPQEKAKAAGLEIPPASVAVTNVQKRAYNLAEKFVAFVEPVQEVKLYPQVDGYIKEIKFKEGDIVKEGAVLYTIDDERYAAVVNQRKADLAAAEAEADRARRYRDRMEKADKRGITQQDLDNAISGDMTAKAAVKQAEANLVVAEYDMNHAVVKAPFGGKIGKSNVHLGDFVSPSKGDLATLVQIDPIRVRFPLTDRQRTTWRENQLKDRSVAKRMRVILPTGDEYKGGDGTFDFDDNEMNSATATLSMRLRFANKNALLVPNMYVTLLADYEKPPVYSCVPQSAVFDLPGGNEGVWVVKKDGTVTARNVETLEHDRGWVPVVKGLEGDETIVTSGVGKLNEGAKVFFVAPTSNDENDPNHKSYDDKEKELQDAAAGKKAE